MKRISFVVIIFMLMSMATGFAQNPVTTIDSLVIDLWPDYDKPSVLVLLTGTLPGDTQFPAAVTIPVPESAKLNAVARIDSKDGKMKDDIYSSPGPSGTLRFITPDLRFRIEYYFPYIVNKNRRSFDYTWIAELSVNTLQLKVQRPLSASSLNATPGTGNVVKAEDGFDYRTYPVQAVPAGQPFSVHVEYNMTTSQLSVASLRQPSTGWQTSELPDKSSTDSNISWALVVIVAGGLIIIIALVWQVVSRRSLSDTKKPLRKKVPTESPVKFCRNCGEPVNEGDKFCRECGEHL